MIVNAVAVTIERIENELYQGMVTLKIPEYGLEKRFSFRQEYLTSEYVKLTITSDKGVCVEISGDAEAALEMLLGHTEQSRILFEMIGKMITMGKNAVAEFRAHPPGDDFFRRVDGVLRKAGLMPSYPSTVVHSFIVDDGEIAMQIRLACE